MASGSLYGFWLDKPLREDCNTSLALFTDNTAHSNLIGGVLVSASQCMIPSLPDANIVGLLAFKHPSSGLVLDNLQSALVSNPLLAGNNRYTAKLLFFAILQDL